jgi:AcrR family transcriptional regulator
MVWLIAPAFCVVNTLWYGPAMTTGSPAAKRPRDERNSKADWVRAGLSLLMKNGIGGVRIEQAATRLGVTKGSFYWHFADLPAYRAALIEAWGSLQDQDRQHFEDSSEVAPRERLRHMMQAVMKPQQWALERAMRVWALTDDVVAANVRKSDGRVLRAVYQAFLDAGFDADDAGIRSAVFFGAGMALLHGAAPSDALTEMQDRFLDFVLRP